MKRLWTHKDGRLKISSVSITLFVMMLAIAGGLMQLNQPVDEALVQIKHIFRAESDPVQKVTEETNTQVEQPVKVEQPSPEVSETKANPDPVAETVPKTPAEQQREVRGEMASESQVSLTSGGDKAVSNQELSAEAAAEIVETVEIKAKEPAAMIVQESIDETEQKPSITNELVEEHVQTETDPFRKLQQDTISKVDDQRQSSGVTVPPEQYQEIFKAWRSADFESDKEATRPGLLVENLREVYPLFQMKPVALVAGVAYDLEDGSRLDERSLERYTKTVFQVARPWDDWGLALRRIGLRPADTVEVRYYMHGYVHNGIYSRCAQAIAWGKENGLLSADANTAEVEVRGRAYVVRQQGGGQFGVFIPNQLRLIDGQIVGVHSDAFDGAADVSLLRTTGAI
jgi:hypothetical protein